MHSVTTKKAALAALLVLAALLSIFAVGKRASDPAYHQASIDALAEKQETVLELTAASTAASAAITLLPGDTATPIAEKLADLSGYFLIVLCAIFLEKYLLTITSCVSFTILIPAACALGIAALFSEKLRAALGKLAWHLLLFALAIAFAIPAGVKVSSMIETHTAPRSKRPSQTPSRRPRISSPPPRARRTRAKKAAFPASFPR